MKKYKAAKGASFGDDKAQVYGRHLERLQKRFGYLQPELVVDDARADDSPLHEAFEWNNRKAAGDWRKWQARHLMNTIVTVKIIDGEEKEARAFYNVTICQDAEEETKKVYISLDSAFKHDHLASQIIERAKAELIGWKNRYATYRKIREQFADVLDAIEKVKTVR